LEIHTDFSNSQTLKEKPRLFRVTDVSRGLNDANANWQTSREHSLQGLHRTAEAAPTLGDALMYIGITTVKRGRYMNVTFDEGSQ
jgi:hypothetical protein